MHGGITKDDIKSAIRDFDQALVHQREICGELEIVRTNTGALIAMLSPI